MIEQPLARRIDDATAIAVIGLAGRFPGASTVEEFWHNLRTGTESISHFSPEEMIALGVEPSIATRPRFVGAEGVLDDIAGFDAEFFGYSPREAEIMDPQHRLCLEVAWEVFDAAGYDPSHVDATVGVFLSTSLSSYLVRNLLPRRDLIETLGGFALLIHNDKDFLATTVSHRLGLTGPSLAVATACSSSLVATHLACQSLWSFESDLALAGGVSVQVPSPQGYVYSDAGIYSPDGHCRAFDAAASGTVGGSGVGLVLLKRWADAQRDRDHVYALLLGSAVNNDGARRLGYTAPSVAGQSSVIVEAHEAAGVGADDVEYVEAHGTGTALGDPVEIEALTQAFRRTTRRRQFCAVGSVKTNVGHLDAAAGVTSLIKTVLAVHRATIPASLNFATPNPHIDFAASPFYVNAVTRTWSSDRPRTAGVSAFGIGGTNAHVVVREAPPPHPAPTAPRRWQPLVMSTRDEQTLRRAADQLADHLRANPGLRLADVAFTLSGRREFAHRRATVSADLTSAIAALEADPAAAGLTGFWDGQARPVVFLFPGQGAHHAGMATELYRDEPTFRAHLDACAHELAALGVDLIHVLSDPSPDSVQPALFAVEYALAQTLEEWGVVASALIGHSLGEYVAATIAGVLSLADALRLVRARGLLCARLPAGRMTAVAAAWARVAELADRAGVTLSADNGPDQCVVGGPPSAMDAFTRALARAGVRAHPLGVAHAYHSAAVDAIAAEFLDAASRARLRAPQRPYLSNLTGDWVASTNPVTPEYWVRHLREPVRFGDGVRAVLAQPGAIVLEVAACTVLASLVRRHPDRTDQLVLACQPPAADAQPRAAALVTTLAKAWVAGAPVRWRAFHDGQGAHRVPCPAYPFDHKRFWVEPPANSMPPARAADRDNVATFLNSRLAARRAVASIDDYPGLRAGLDELCRGIAAGYLAKAGPDLRPGRRVSVGWLARRLRVLPEYEPFLAYMLGLLVEDGLARRDRDGITVVEPLDRVEASVLASQLIARYPQFRGLVELLVRCANHYDRALSTNGVALGVLYPDGRGDLLHRLLGERTVAHTSTGTLVDLVAELAEWSSRRAPRPLRVLEVGAGSGRLTWPVAQALRDRPARYLATDVGRLFITELDAEARRRGLAFVRTAALDLSQDPARQGLGDDEFDLIVGLDVVHATPDVRVSLAALRGLLAPGGLLALIETTSPDRWQSMIWGLSSDWWSFTDDLRDGQPLLRPGVWATVVAEAGFLDPIVLPPPDRPAGTDSALIVATRDASCQPSAGQSVPAALPAKRADPADWLYLPSWAAIAPAIPAPVPAIAAPDPGSGRASVVVFTGGPFGDAVASRLRDRGDDVAEVRPGSTYRAGADATFTIDPGEPDHYRALLADLAGRGRAASHAVHAWGGDVADDPITDETLDARVLRGLHSLLFLAQAHGQQENGALRRVVAVTAGAQDVLGGDLINPDLSMIAAAAKVIPREYLELTCRAVDVPCRRLPADESWLAHRVVDELFTDAGPTIVAYRGRRRWQPQFTPLSPRPATRAVVRPGGVYLVTGGLGGIGLALAEFLARTPATVVLTGRSEFPPRRQWPRLGRPGSEDPRARTVARLLAMRAGGAEVHIETADVTSRPDMARVLELVRARFGEVNGVIHAAGVVDDAGMIARRGRASTDAVLAARVRGTLVLDRLLRGVDLDFFVLCSSLGPILYRLKFGEVGYVAGHEFLNAFAAHRVARGGTAVAISWTDWVEGGMWARARQRLARFALDPSRGTAAARTDLAIRPSDDLLQGITDAEGTAVFQAILGHVSSADIADIAAHQVVVSTQDLAALLAHHEAFTTTAHRRLVDRLRLTATPRTHADRHREPLTSAEEVGIAAIWQALLGVDGIGAEDSFFELGGDSLLALRFLSLLRDEFEVDHPIARLYEAPTLRAVAADITQARAAAPGLDGFDEVLL